MFELAGGSDDCTLAVAFDDARVAAKGCDQGLRHGEAEGLQVFHKLCDVFDVGTGKRIVNNSEVGPPPLRYGGYRAAFMENIFEKDKFFPDADLKHEGGSRIQIGQCHPAVN